VRWATPSGSAMTETLERCLAFVRAVDARTAERTERTRFGTALFVDALPRVWSLNFVAVDRGVKASAQELAADADAVQGAAGLEHRRVVVEEDELGASLAQGFRALGWRAQSLLVMPHTRSDRRVRTSPVREIARAELDPVWAIGIREEPWGRDEETVRQLVLQRQVIQRATNARYFAAVADGVIASYCELYSDGETAQIEGVLTLPQFRRRGLAASVVTRALTEAEQAHGLVFLLAEAGEWPKELYRKLGFEAVGRTWDFVSSPALAGRE
jgi:ribosomal protein S18 acetylase RimI-like enzyme